MADESQKARPLSLTPHYHRMYVRAVDRYLDKLDDGRLVPLEEAERMAAQIAALGAAMSDTRVAPGEYAMVAVFVQEAGRFATAYHEHLLARAEVAALRRERNEAVIRENIQREAEALASLASASHGEED